jgi:hypothetical protein
MLVDDRMTLCQLSDAKHQHHLLFTRIWFFTKLQEAIVLMAFGAFVAFKHYKCTVATEATNAWLERCGMGSCRSQMGS